MTTRRANPILCGALAFALSACALAPSRVPLGGNYAIAETEPERRREAEVTAAHSPPEAAGPMAEAVQPDPATRPPIAAPPVGAPITDATTVQYAPLKRGNSIRADVTISFKARLSGGQAALPGNGALGLDATFHVEVKITQVSAQSLDELELTLTPLTLRTQFGGKSTVMPAAGAKTFEVTLGNSPSVSERGGGKPDAEERAVLMLLVAPLAAFHERWARSPTLELKPGYFSEAAISAPAILGPSSDHIHIGAFTARYTGRDATGTGVPFQVAVPLEYRTEMGRLTFDLAGSARLSDKQGRPIAIDLSGPIDGAGGPQGQFEFHGTEHISARLDYP